MFLVTFLCLFLCPRSHNVSTAVTKPNVLVQGNSSDSFDRIPVLDNPGAPPSLMNHRLTFLLP